MPYRGYKRPGDTNRLGKLVDELLIAVPWLDLGEADFVCRARHDALDAVVAALTARAAELNLTLRPARPRKTAAARTEGRIAIPLPDSHLDQLLENATRAEDYEPARTPKSADSLT